MNIYELAPRFRALFDGLDTAYGTGKGQWIKRPPRTEDFVDHLQGRGPGIGIAPLRPDGTVKFAAIDYDVVGAFETGREFQKWLPGPSFMERTRNGKVHVWVFFSEPIEAWVARGILKYAITSVTDEVVEVFPKQDSFDRVRMGNYINLPYHGNSRFVLSGGMANFELPLSAFLDAAEAGLNSPADWRKRAAWLMIDDPATKRSDGPAAEFGQQPNLHMCAEWVIEGVLDGTRPITQGSKSVVYFNLAKQFANCSLWDKDEAWEALQELAAASPDPPNMSEVARFLRNAYEKRYTSTGCDDPVFAPYAHPNCPIANPRRSR